MSSHVMSMYTSTCTCMGYALIHVFRRRHFIAIWEMTAHFIRNMGDEVKFYWQFEKFIGYTCDEVGRSFYSCPKLFWLLAGASFHGPSSSWRSGRLDHVIHAVAFFLQSYSMMHLGSVYLLNRMFHQVYCTELKSDY